MLYESARLADFSFSDVPQRRKRADSSFFALVIILLTMGIIMVLSSSYARAYYDPGKITGGDPIYFFVRQLIYALFGVGAMIAASFIPVSVYRKYAFHFLGAVVILLPLCRFLLFCPQGNESLSRKVSLRY